MLVVHFFKPFVGGIFAGDFHGYVRKPAVFFSSVPMFYFGRNDDYVAGCERACGLSPFLVSAFACDAKKYLTSAFCRVVYVPVVAARRLEGHVCHKNAVRMV